MKFERKQMVDWYNPKQLAFTATKTVVSGIFGNFADRREMQAALDPGLKPHDVTEKDEIWIDFIADLGDGFNATYSMAHLLAQEHLIVSDEKIQRGDILIMGGDQVYPTPELEEYDNRLRGPYHAAFPLNKEEKSRPLLFALPGNHDWYDGLTNFLRLFTQERTLGNWQSKQRRSYFAIKLPHNTWLLGIDVQLHADIDHPQLCYFKEVAQTFADNDKIILCTAEPSWVFQSMNRNDKSNERLNFFINRILFGAANEEEERAGILPEKQKRKIELIAILTGDMHHYSRYEAEGDLWKRQLITAGGGGAFMHCTHTLPTKLADGTTLKSAFPPLDTSKALVWRNLLLPFYSLWFTIFFGGFHLLTAWFLQLGNKETVFLQNVGMVPGDFLLQLTQNLPYNPPVLILNLILWIGIWRFTDTQSGKSPWTYIAGFVHATLQVVLFYWLYLLNARWSVEAGSLDIVRFIVGLFVSGGLASGLLFGLYLFVSINWVGNHITEASSSFRWEGYKNFLRLKLTADGLTIYPVGVEKIATNWKNTGTEENPSFEGGPVNYELIEPPIYISFAQVTAAQPQLKSERNEQHH